MIRIKTLVASFLVLFLGFTIQAKAQSFAQQQRQFMAYNVGLNALIGGVGGLINKKKGEKWHQAFLKNMGFGAVGGLIKYHAKYEVYNVREGGMKGYAYLNRMYYYLGHSIVNNASLNRKVYSSYSFQLFLANVELSWQDQFKIKPKLSLTTLFHNTQFLVTGHRINLKKSLNYAIIYYDRGKILDDQIGFGSANAIGAHVNYKQYYSDPSFLIPHELAHTYQLSDYFLISNFTNTSFKRVKDLKVYKFLDRFIYWDIDIFYPLYWAQLKVFGEPRHFNNYYEFEAHSYGTRMYIRR